jgi:hypothetical protein
MRPGSMVEATFEISSVDDGSGTHAARATHIERHFTAAEVTAALSRCGFDCLDVYGVTQDGQLQQPLDEAVHGKAVYIAR